MAIQTPLHREGLDLGHNFHGVDAAVTGDATDTTCDVDAVVEVNKIRQVVNAFPHDWHVLFETDSNRFQQCAFGMNDPKCSLTFGCAISTVAVSTSCGRRNRCVPCLLNSVVAVAAIKLQLSGVELVTERYWLFRLVPNIDDVGMNRRIQTGGQIAANRDRGNRRQQCELVNPCWEMKFLHQITE